MRDSKNRKFTYISNCAEAASARKKIREYFNATSNEELNQIKQAAIKGKIDLKGFDGIDPSPVSGELGHGKIGNLGAISRSVIYTILDK